MDYEQPLLAEAGSRTRTSVGARASGTSLGARPRRAMFWNILRRATSSSTLALPYSAVEHSRIGSLLVWNVLLPTWEKVFTDVLEHPSARDRLFKARAAPERSLPAGNVLTQPPRFGRDSDHSTIHTLHFISAGEGCCGTPQPFFTTTVLVPFLCSFVPFPFFPCLSLHLPCLFRRSLASLLPRAESERTAVFKLPRLERA